MAQVIHTTDTGQDGFSLFGTWQPDTDDGFSLSEGLTSRAGLIFNVGVNTNSIGYPLAQPRIGSLSLRLTTHPDMTVNPGAAVVQAWIVNETNPQNYGPGFIPLARGEQLIGQSNFVWTGVGTQVTVDFSLDAFETYRTTRLSSALWAGRIAVSLMITTTVILKFNSSESAGTGPELLADQASFFAGLTGGPTGPRQRFVLDGRFGMPALNTELVRDGDSPGLWVRPSDQDPEDEQATYRPKPGEGTVDDKIPNI